MTAAQLRLFDAIERRLSDQRAVAQMLASSAVICRIGGNEAKGYLDDLVAGLQVVSTQMQEDLSAAKADLRKLMALTHEAELALSGDGS